MAVGRDGAQRRLPGPLCGVQVDTVQIVARLLGRDRKARLLDQALEVGRRDFERMAHLAGGEIREVVRGDGLQCEP